MAPRAQRVPLNILFGLQAHATSRARQLALRDDVAAYSFGELWDAATRFAGSLRARGVRQGSVVGIAMDGSAAYIAALLASLLAGAAAAPVNTALTPSELERYLDVLEPDIVVANGNGLECLPVGTNVWELDADRTATRLEERLAIPSRSSDRCTVGLRRPDDAPALLFPTGGTTGLPKATMLSHRAVLLWAMSLAGHGGSGVGVELFVLPFFHVGLLTGPLSTLHAGGPVVLEGKFDPERAVDHILRNGATRVLAVPTMIRRLCDTPGFDRARQLVEWVTFGGMASAPEFIDELLNMFPGAKLSTSYGATEFGPVTRMRHDDILRGRRTGTGRPVPAARVTIEDEHGVPVEAGTPGDVVVQCPWQASGYLGRPEETAATFTTSGVRLADTGVIAEDGWLTLLGRKSEMIITGGENVFPAEVEAVLATHPDIDDVVVVGVPDTLWGERVDAVVVARPGVEIATEALREFARAQLAPYKLPRSVRQVDKIPLTPNNKPDRRALVADVSAS